MVAELESRNTHKVYEKDKIGEVQIADEVVAIIAGLAATEVEGVDSMAGNITNELVGKLGMKNLSKGVKVDVTEEHVSVDFPPGSLPGEENGYGISLRYKDAPEGFFLPWAVPQEPVT